MCKIRYKDTKKTRFKIQDSKFKINAGADL